MAAPVDISRAINLAHLNALSTTVSWRGEPALLTHIYAEPPSYKPVVAPGEGIAAVDDVARAAIVYLDEHARTGNEHSLTQARAALNFTMYMQQPSGTFANFVVDQQGTINMDGPTSKPGLGWWAMRGMWALARGYKGFREVDPAYAGRLLQAYERTESALRDLLARNEHKTVQVRGRDVPAWLVALPADQASVGAIALAELQEVRPSEATHSALTQVAEGVAALAAPSAGAAAAVPFVPQSAESPDTWHAWGAHAGEALARAGQVLRRPDLVEAAKVDVDGVLAWQLAAGRAHEMLPLPVREGQQAYGIGTATRAAMAVYRATGDERYAQMAGLHASWLLGNNMAGEPMYDVATGRTYDGIDGPPRGINRASGAESTIEGLMALQAIAGTPEAERFAQFAPVAGRSQSWTSVPLRVAAGQTASTDVEVPVGGTFNVLVGSAAGRGGVQVSIDGAAAGKLAVANRTPTLRPLDGSPVALGAGRHRLTLTATGGAAAVGIVLHPAQTRSELRHPDGTRLALDYDLAAKRLGYAVTGAPNQVVSASPSPSTVPSPSPSTVPSPTHAA